MNKYTRLMLAALIPAAWLAPAAWAGGGHGHGGMAMMHRADANGDGKVTRNEFLAAAKQRAERMFNHMDVNGDGVLDVRDHEARFFDRMDANHDGVVSRAEFRAFHRKMHKARHAKTHKGGDDD